jgi:hypothetical protein
MKTCSRCTETKELTEFTWRKSDRHSAGGYYASRCKVCVSTNTKAWYAQNKDRALASQEAWRAANRDRWNAAMAATSKRYQVAKTDRVPPWYDHARAQEVYDFAAEFRQAGFEVDVDHIVPLQGETFSGLHWHGNLRVCLATANRSRRNRLCPHHGPLAV